MPETSLASLPLPPGPAGWAGWKTVRRAVRDPRPVFEALATYGDVAMARVGGRGLALVSHPDLVRELLVAQHRHFRKSRTLQRARILLGDGLLTSEGALHLRQRRLVQPAFHRDRIEAYAQTMIALADARASRWREGATIDAHAEMMRLTLAIAARTLFSADVDDAADEIGHALTTVLGMFDRLNHPLAPLLQRLPTPRTRRFDAAAARLDATIQRIVDERRASARDAGDLLSILLLERDAEGNDPGATMTDRQVRDEALTLLLAGHETTANALTWTWLLLAEHPEAEARLHAELDAVLGGRTPMPGDLRRLEYTRRVLTEAMRLYPPAWVVGREALVDVTLGGFRVPRGSMVFASQWIVQRDARFFPDPLRFDPDRWLPEHAGVADRSAYFPFGAGTRKCIGEQFAWTEGVLVLATLGRRWRLARASDGPVEPQASITLRPHGPVPMRLTRRATTGA